MIPHLLYNALSRTNVAKRLHVPSSHWDGHDKPHSLICTMHNLLFRSRCQTSGGEYGIGSMRPSDISDSEADNAQLTRLLGFLWVLPSHHSPYDILIWANFTHNIQTIYSEDIQENRTTRTSPSHLTIPIYSNQTIPSYHPQNFAIRCETPSGDQNQPVLGSRTTAMIFELEASEGTIGGKVVCKRLESHSVGLEAFEIVPICFCICNSMYVILCV